MGHISPVPRRYGHNRLSMRCAHMDAACMVAQPMACLSAVTHVFHHDTTICTKLIAVLSLCEVYHATRLCSCIISIHLGFCTCACEHDNGAAG